MVGVEDLATSFGSGTVDVLATPRVLAWMESACLDAIDGALGPAETTVGMRAQLDHVAPSVLDAVVRATAELERVEGRRLSFTVRVTDGRGEIANGRLTRIVVDTKRFLDKATTTHL